MTEKLEKELHSICPTCKKESYFEYIGTSEIEDEKPIHLYNCGSCSSTISLESFYEKNPKASSQ